MARSLECFSACKLLLSFLGLQSLLLACLGLLVLLGVDLACFQSAEFCISRGLTLAVSGFVSTNEFASQWLNLKILYESPGGNQVDGLPPA